MPGRSSLALRAGNVVLDVLPPRAATVAWRVFQTSHVSLFRATRGRVGAKLGGVRILLLHHVGRRSGQERVSPLLYVEDGGKLAIIASKGGHPKHPAWFHNLMAQPDTEVELGSERRQVRARVADGEERERIWDKAVASWPDYDRYQARTERRIPVVVLDRR
ncbi:MAG: nitroreductase family deazaflavin-dependent oxidoreductase [Thermoleophilaceae bacterium]